MTNPPVFTISPGSAPFPHVVTLSMSPGYQAQASITDVCGKPLTGGSVSVTGLTATPHLPAGFAGTFFVQWSIERAGQHHGLGIVMTLEARERQGAATTCPTATTASKQQAVTQPKAGSLVVLPGHGGFPVGAVAGGGGGLVAVALVAAVLWRRFRARGGHTARAVRRG